MPYVTVDFQVVFYDDADADAVPAIAIRVFNQTLPLDDPTRNAWNPATQDLSTAYYFDYVCLYESAYDILVPPAVGLYRVNSTQLREPFESGLAWTESVVFHEGLRYSRFTWKPPCSMIGVQPVCWGEFASVRVLNL